MKIRSVVLELLKLMDKTEIFCSYSFRTCQKRASVRVSHSINSVLGNWQATRYSVCS